MAEKIIRVGQENQTEFYEYAARHGAEHDSSYLPGRDFEISEEHPAYLLIDQERVLGAVSLMRIQRYLSIHQGRFSIFHSVLGTREAYARLLEATRPHCKDLRRIFLFIPEGRTDTARILEDLGFEIERYSFILEREGPALPDPAFPPGVQISPLDSGDLLGAGQFADCLNQAFKHLAGHTPSTAEDILSWFEDQSYLKEGLCLLKDGGAPIGTIALMRDLDEPKAGEILGFGLLESYRGRGLGRSLFRYGTNFLLNKGLRPVYLSVNGENHNAIKLYQSEGFKLTESVVCYSLQIK